MNQISPKQIKYLTIFLVLEQVGVVTSSGKGETFTLSNFSPSIERRWWKWWKLIAGTAHKLRRGVNVSDARRVELVT